MKRILLFFIVLLVLTNIGGAKWFSDSNITTGLIERADDHSSPTIFYNGDLLQLMSGQRYSSDAFDGYDWNGSSWILNSSLSEDISSYDDGYTPDGYATPNVYFENNTMKMISGEWYDGYYLGFTWNGVNFTKNGRVSELGRIYPNGLTDLEVYNHSGILTLITGDNNGVFRGFTWNSSTLTWISNSSAVSGLYDIGIRSSPTVYLDEGVYKLISGENDGYFNGFTWNGSSWISDPSIVSGISNLGVGKPEVFNHSGTLKMITGTSGNFYGYFLNHVSFNITNFTDLNLKVIDHTPNIVWNNSNDVDNDVLTTYVYVGTTATPTTLDSTTTSQTTNLGVNTTLLDGTTYYYRLRNWDGYEWTNYTISDEFRMNSDPTISNVTLSPDPTAVENDLTALNDTATDTDGDPITLYYKWYKNTILQSSLTTSTVGSSNTSNGELWKVGIIPNDGYENGTEVQSQTVEIGSSNSAPTLTGVNIDKSYPLKRYANFTITSENASDPNNDPRKLEVGSATGLSDLGIGDYFTNGNESNITIAMPFYDGNSHILYIRLNDSNLTSQEYTIIIESDTTLPVLNSESISPATGTQGIPFGITINTTSLNSTISTVTVNVARPDATSANWTLSNTVNDTWYYNYLSTSDIGTYTVNYFTITDASDNVKTATSSLSFTITAAVVTGGGGGGGGGGGTTIIQTGNITDLTITPPRLDTYVLYGGFGEDRMLKYRFIANRNITSCLVDSKEEGNDIATCVVTDGYIVDIYLTINDSKGYSGTITVRDSDEFVATSDLIIRVLDIGAYIKIVNIPVGEAIASLLNPFFASANGVLIGIRVWGMGATVGLLGLALFKSDIFE